MSKVFWDQSSKKHLHSFSVERVADLQRVPRDEADRVLLLGVVRIARGDRDEVVLNINGCDDRRVPY